MIRHLLSSATDNEANGRKRERKGTKGAGCLVIFNNWILRLDLLACADVDGKCNLKAFTFSKRVFLSSCERIDLGIEKKRGRTISHEAQSAALIRQARL